MTCLCACVQKSQFVRHPVLMSGRLRFSLSPCCKFALSGVLQKGTVCYCDPKMAELVTRIAFFGHKRKVKELKNGHDSGR